MKLEERNLLAQSYQAAWYALKGQAIAVSPQENGWFLIRFPGRSLPQKVRSSQILRGIAEITETLALKRGADIHQTV